MAPLIPERLRPWVPAVLVGMGAAFALLAASVWHGHRALGVDLSVQRALGVPAWSRRADQHLGDMAAALGSAPVVVAASLVLAAAAWRRGRDWSAFVLTGIALPVALVVDHVLKPVVGRRYYGTGYRFPSGHAATVAAVVVVAWLLFLPGSGDRRSGTTAVVAVVAGVAAMGAVSWGLLMTRAHSPIDVLGGWLFGAGAALGAAAVLEVAADRVATGVRRG